MSRYNEAAHASDLRMSEFKLAALKAAHAVELTDAEYGFALAELVKAHSAGPLRREREAPPVSRDGQPSTPLARPSTPPPGGSGVSS